MEGLMILARLIGFVAIWYTLVIIYRYVWMPFYCKKWPYEKEIFSDLKIKRVPRGWEIYVAGRLEQTIENAAPWEAEAAARSIQARVNNK